MSSDEITSSDAAADAASKPYILIEFHGKNLATFDYTTKDINAIAQLPAVVALLDGIIKMELGKLFAQQAIKERSGLVIPSLQRQ